VECSIEKIHKELTNLIIMNSYRISFENFLRCTNEKEILLASMSDYIKKLKIKSLLDIGAGNGDIAIPLSRMVDSYMAVEKNENFVKKLSSKKINVIKANFPEEKFKLKKKFDLVLCSYVIPHNKDFKKFISEAWEYINSGGHLLIITHSRSRDECGKFFKKIKFKNFWDNPSFFPRLINYLKILGKVSVKEVMSTIRSVDLHEFFSALAFIASGGESDKEKLFYKKKEEIEKVIKRDYKKEIYEFPLKHYFILCNKP